jgi:hypothetical protein
LPLIFELAHQGAFIATVEYNVASGDMKVGSREPFLFRLSDCRIYSLLESDVSPIFSNQPTGNVMVSAPVIECGQTFSANISTPFSGSSSLRRPLLSLVLYTAVVLVGILVSKHI